MKDFKSKKQFKRPMLKDSSAKMPAEVGMILMFMHMEEPEPIFVEKNPHSSSLLRASLEDPD